MNKSVGGQTLDRLLTVSAHDPDDARRRKLLTVILLVSTVSAAIMLALTSMILFAGFGKWSEVELIYVGGGVLIAGMAGLYWVNRYWSGRAASIAFLVMFVLVSTFSDIPTEVVAGRSLLLFAVPIILASVLLSPLSSFLWAALSSLAVMGLAVTVPEKIPSLPPTMVSFLFIAFVAWLAARSLEIALRDLRLLNTELDKRVAERTLDLNEALIRVREEAGKNQAILESITDGVILFDTSGRAVTCNPAIVPLLGLEPAAVLDAALPAIMDGRVPAKDQENLLNPLRQTPTEPLTTKLNWEAKTLSVSLAPVLDESRQLLGQVAVFRDFTREAELDRLKTLFLSMVSHELRTPLNSLMGYAEMLLDQVYGPLAPRQQEIVGRVLSNTQRLLRIVNDLLDQTQLEAGRLLLHPALVEPTVLVQSVSDTLIGFAQSKKLQLSLEIDPEVPARLQGDQQRLQQILVNLVTNAIRYTDTGEVRVRLFRPEPDQWGLMVKDTGAGIARDAQAYIFEPFRQVKPAMDDRRTRGVGLGLSIVKQLVDLMGGKITLVSAVGQGSTFTVTLPLTLPVEAKK
jgi:PAS domain S-box-containing protein